MALKFLNKKGWHTGSLRNIENVWKAEQKHEAEQKKLEELRKQIQEERERSEFRLLQEQAGLVPKQERLEFLYDSGLAVGKRDAGFKALESFPSKTDHESAVSSSSAKQSSVPGALFEEKPQSANDAWRKLHSDPLLLIRQREQEALARVKNNPVQMAMIRKSVEEVMHKRKTRDEKDEKLRTKHHDKQSRHHNEKLKHHKHSSSKTHSEVEGIPLIEQGQRKGKAQMGLEYDKTKCTTTGGFEEELGKKVLSREKYFGDPSNKGRYPGDIQKTDKSSSQQKMRRKHEYIEYAEFKGQMESGYSQKGHKHGTSTDKRHSVTSDMALTHEAKDRHRKPVRLSKEERAARLQEMQKDAELHEEQRWKRLKKAEESDAQEAINAHVSRGKSFLDDAQRSIFGAEKGGSSTIEESVRRRTYYLQGRSEASESNAFRR